LSRSIEAADDSNAEGVLRLTAALGGEPRSATGSAGNRGSKGWLPGVAHR